MCFTTQMTNVLLASSVYDWKPTAVQTLPAGTSSRRMCCWTMQAQLRCGCGAADCRQQGYGDWLGGGLQQQQLQHVLMIIQQQQCARVRCEALWHEDNCTDDSCAAICMTQCSVFLNPLCWLPCMLQVTDFGLSRMKVSKWTRPGSRCCLLNSRWGFSVKWLSWHLEQHGVVSKALVQQLPLKKHTPCAVTSPHQLLLLSKPCPSCLPRPWTSRRRTRLCPRSTWRPAPPPTWPRSASRATRGSARR